MWSFPFRITWSWKTHVILSFLNYRIINNTTDPFLSVPNHVLVTKYPFHSQIPHVGKIFYICSVAWTMILDIISLVLSVRFLSMNNNFLYHQSLTYYYQWLNTPITTNPPRWIMDLACPTHIMNSCTLETSTYNPITLYLKLTSNP